MRSLEEISKEAKHSTLKNIATYVVGVTLAGYAGLTNGQSVTPGVVIAPGSQQNQTITSPGANTGYTNKNEQFVFPGDGKIGLSNDGTTVSRPGYISPNNLVDDTETLDELIKQNPKEAINLAGNELNKNNLDVSELMYVSILKYKDDKKIELSKDQLKQTYIGLGQTYYLKGRIDASIIAYTVAQRLSPNDPVIKGMIAHLEKKKVKK